MTDLPSRHLPAVRLRVDGMSCAGCAAGIERTLRRHPAVAEARVRYADGTARVSWDPEAAALDSILDPVRSQGFEVRPGDDVAAGGRAEADAEAARWAVLRLAVSAFFAMNTMLAALLVHLDQLPPGAPRRLALLVSGVAATPVVFFGGWPFHRRAVRGLASGAAGMDLLVSLGALAAYALSVASLALGREEAWFDTAAMIVVFLLIGRQLEAAARRRGVDAVGKLVALAPDLVRTADAGNGETVHRFADELAVGEVFRLRPGERAALDGRVTGGISTVDRSPLTGESAPVLVRPGDLIDAGTLNLTGALELEVVRPVGERALDRVAAAVSRFLDARAPLEGLADRVARHFVAVVLLLGAGTLALALATDASVPDAVLRATAVIVIACPCALGLATPLALTVAAGHGARRGILFRDGAALERAARIDEVAFDKTGTLTTGRPRVVAVHPAAGVAPGDVLALAAVVEADTLHPFGQAIRRAAAETPACSPGLEELERREVPGAGVVAERAGRVVARVGQRDWMEAEGVDGVDPGALPVARESRVHVARDERWLGAVDLADELRGDAHGAVAALREAGMGIHLWTGDDEDAAQAIAEALALAPDQVASGLSPEDKARLAIEAQAGGQRRIAFVGDGTNDAPALAAADLGIAVQGATDVALETADVVVRAGGLSRVVEALAHARRTRRVMFRNFGWAVLYNALALPAAVAGWVPPAVAALAMAASSASVALSSLTLGRRDAATSRAERRPADRPTRPAPRPRRA